MRLYRLICPLGCPVVVEQPDPNGAAGHHCVKRAKAWVQLVRQEGRKR